MTGPLVIDRRKGVLTYECHARNCEAKIVAPLEVALELVEFHQQQHEREAF